MNNSVLYYNNFRVHTINAFNELVQKINAHEEGGFYISLEDIREELSELRTLMVDLAKAEDKSQGIEPIDIEINHLHTD